MTPIIFKLEQIQPMPQIPGVLPLCATVSMSCITVCPYFRVFILLDVHLQLFRAVHIHP